MAVVNSEAEADALRCLYFNYGPDSVVTVSPDSEETDAPNLPTEITLTPEPANATLHIGFHDRFIEGEYLSVRGE